MRHVLLIAAILLSIAAPSFAQEQLVVGNSYSGSVKLSSSNSGLYLALPEGNWTLASFEKTLSSGLYDSVVPMMYGRLVSIDDQKRVVGVVSFGIGNDSGRGGGGGWARPAYCFNKSLFFLHAEVQRRGDRETKCWGITTTGMASPTATASNYVKEFYQYVSLNGLKLPQTAIILSIYRSSGPKFLQAIYYRNPELDGFPRSGTAVWQKDVVVGDPKRLAYLVFRK